jgi:hypothetical protein
MPGAYGVAVTDIPAAAASELARLRAQDCRLLKMLNLSPRQAAPPGPAQAGFFEAPPEPVKNKLPQLGAAAIDPAAEESKAIPSASASAAMSMADCPWSRTPSPAAVPWPGTCSVRRSGPAGPTAGRRSAFARHARGRRPCGPC